MTNSNSTNSTTTETTLEATWTVIKGKVDKTTGKRTKNQYLATIALGTGAPGDRVHLVSKAGVHTTGSLIARVDIKTKTENGAMGLWTINRDTKTAEQMAADRALNEATRLAYWQSDAGVATAARIKERAEKQQQAPAPVANVPAVANVAPATSAPAVTMASLLAELLAAGVSVEMAVATATAALAATEQAPAPVAPKITSTTTSTKQTTSTTTKKGPNKALCMACNSLDVLAPHQAHPELKVCKACKTLEGPTVVARAIKNSTPKG